MGAGVLCGRSAAAGLTGGRLGRHPPPAHPWSALPAATDAGSGPTDVRTSAVGTAWASGGAGGRAACLRRGTSRRTRAGTWEITSGCAARPSGRAGVSCGYRGAAAGMGRVPGRGGVRRRPDWWPSRSRRGRPWGRRTARRQRARTGVGRAAGRVAVSVPFGRRVPLPRSRVRAAGVVSEPCSVSLISITCTPFLVTRSWEQCAGPFETLRTNFDARRRVRPSRCAARRR